MKYQLIDTNRIGGMIALDCSPKGYDTLADIVRVRTSKGFRYLTLVLLKKEHRKAARKQRLKRKGHQ